MQNEQEVKEIVKEKYREIARKTSPGCCRASSTKNSWLHNNER
ncbi:MAG: hypothetical protein FD188_2807 [Ignavibacteria bacterium]|nr:MAG: hypothetical protein FD188_2807 [Ignavibacteria bacterium]